MKIEIGDKPLKELTAEELLEIIMIEGCCPSLEFWNKPEIVEFDNKMFGDTLVLDFISHRKEDGIQSGSYAFFLDFNRFSYHYTKDYEQNKNQPINGRRVGIETLKYLIGQGYNVPIY